MSLPLPEQSSRNRSASTGDSGLPKHEHKRPRLSGSQDNNHTVLAVTTNIDANNPSTAQQITSPSAIDNASSALESPPPSPLPGSQDFDATSPRSKVTINTRPISSQSSALNAQPDSANSAMNPIESHDPTAVHSPSSASATKHDQHETISISSDDEEGGGDSPVIQVAAPEDLDQDPAETRWETISNKRLPRRSSIRPGHVQRTFPFVNQPNKSQLHVTIARISQIFTEGGGNEDGEIFRQIKIWTVEFDESAVGLDYDFFNGDREFWQKFPQLVLGLLKRRVDPPQGLQADDLVEFFVAYMHIAQLVIEADIAKLRSLSEVSDARLVVLPQCPAFLIPIQWIMTSENIPLYENLRDSLNCSPAVLTEMIIDQLLESFADKHITSLNNLFQVMAELFPRRSNLLDPSLNVIMHAGPFINLLARRASSIRTADTDKNNFSTAISLASLEFFKSVDATLDRAITKQQPWLNIETCDKVFKAVTDFVNHLAVRFPQLAMELMVTANVGTSKFEEAERVSLASAAWRFSTALKFVKKGRMEVRVASVQIMAQDLVNVYNDLLRTTLRNLDHATVQFMIDFIRGNDIIRYIIGVDSHPQIIERSANIIGFLCVSSSYRNEDTDIIWQTVAESQDPRAVVALIGVFQSNLENLDVDVLCYLKRKLILLPFERFDVHMLDFAIRLVYLVNRKFQRDYDESKYVVDSDECSVKFCLKMLREANKPDQICTEISSRVRSGIKSVLISQIQLMRGRLRLGEDSDTMHSLLQQLCADISAHNQLANGSILAVSVILSEAGNDECYRIVRDHDIPTLLMNDIAHFCQNATASTPKESIWAEFESQVGLMITLIYKTSQAITESFLTNLWNHVLSNSDLHPRLRYMAWSSLANIFEHSTVRNEAIESLVENFLPSMSPGLYDSAVLRFVQESVMYEMRHAPIDLIQTQQTVTIPGIERVWNIMLTAPQDTVELEASQFIIKQYLDSERVLRRDSTIVEATHLELIDRCVQLVIDAAGHFKTTSDMTMTNSEPDGIPMAPPSDIEMYAMRFHRSLLFLRKFLNSLKAKPRYTPAVNDNLRKILSTFDKKGDVFEVTLQIIGHKSLANIQFKWLLGYENTGAEIWQFLSDITGWTQFTIINGGQKRTLKDEVETLQELRITKGSFMINKVQGSPENAPSRAVRATSPVDNKVMHHFEDLYNLLELDDRFAKEVFDFLRMFSSQEEIVQRLKSMTMAPGELLPVEKPFKLMYYARTLRSCIEDESYSSEPDSNFLTYGIKTILSVLPGLNQLRAEPGTCISIAQGLLEALILGFRARVPAEVSSSYISDGALFCQNVLLLWSQVLNASTSSLGETATCAQIRTPFEALIEGLLHDERLWSNLSKSDLTSCLEQSLLSHQTRDVRQAIFEAICGLTGVNNSKLTTKTIESRTPRMRFAVETINTCVAHMWEILISMLPKSDSAAATCEEYFDSLNSVFRRHRQKLSETSLQAHVEEWKALLLKHQYTQAVGISTQDFFLSSIAKLLTPAIRALPQELNVSNKSYIEDLLSLFLFPPLTDSGSIDASITTNARQQHDPVLDMHTRWTLYELILVLSPGEGSIDTICAELDSSLLPKDFYFQPNTNNDRQCLRSEAGYSGLRNLSNTCYLNSLVSQLFMNVEFRELVMSVNIIDHSKQKLVAELGKVFAHMQMSYEEAVNPESAISAITLWDGDQIDVTVQMDVDEFFNLLFDRLESQIIDPKVCNVFKGIYGGQLVQQIKSKECEHVSERLEPFTTVQVEIKGKASLEESLRAYVEGEVLQGENKYSCTGCGKHVDAVKRACLKTVPDHLIFNLKRFDYDIMTGMRCKVNDEFGFPTLIDMAPYTLDALANSGQSTKQDVFELVGIIIHSGTAESGHYYSYIRQRPSNMPIEKSWVQFNDHDVTQFDPASIKECCFGGIDFGAIQCPKFYNGYMLFYQRSSSIIDFQRKYLKTDSLSPVRLSVEPDLELLIAQQNELFLRSYVAQDPVHAKFLKSLLQLKQLREDLKCAPQHEDTASKLIVVTLDYMNQLSARWKDLPEVEETLTILRNFASECERCAQVIIKWLMKEDNLANNLVRSCYVAVRRGFTAIIMTCWTKWNSCIRPHRELLDEEASVAYIQRYSSCLKRFLTKMAEAWEHLQRYGRAWEQYFGLLQNFLRTGEHEACEVVQAGFLGLTLELVHVHVPSSPGGKRLRTKYSTYLLQRERNRPFAHAQMLRFLADLLPYVYLDLQALELPEGTVLENRVTLSQYDALQLGVLDDIPQLTWLRKAIYGRHNPAAVNSIIECLCATKQFDQALSNMLRDGLADRDLVWTTACLQPTITFITFSSAHEIVIELVGEALDLVESTNGQYSKEFLNFVQDVLQMSNDAIPITQGALLPLVKQHIPNWAPVLLMAPNDIHSDVRGDTVDLVNTILIGEMDSMRLEDPRQYRLDVGTCRSLADACATYAESAFIHARSPTIHPGQAAHVSSIVEHCLAFFGSTASDDESAARITTIMEEFQARADGVVETITEADWNASSDLEAMSEVDNMSDTSN